MSKLAQTFTRPNLDRAQIAFDIAPMAMWLEDFSGVADLCAELRAAGVTDLRRELSSQPALVAEAVRRIYVVDVNQAAVDLVGAPSRSSLIGHLPTSLLSDTAYAALAQQFVAVWEGTSSLALPMVGSDFDGAEMDLTLHWAAHTRDGAPDYSNVVVTIQDVTHKQRAKRQAQEHAEQLAALLETGRRISSSLDIDTTLRRISDSVVEAVGSDASLLLLCDDTGQRTTRVAGGNHATAALANADLEEILHGISNWVIESGRSAVSVDIAVDLKNRGIAPVRARRFAGLSVAVTPITADGEVIGTLTGLNGPRSPAITGTQLALIETLASHAAVAIQNATLYEQINSAHRELKLAQARLLQSQKLEAIGSLAAGVAHEINTPIQYVANNTKFLRTAVDATQRVLQAAERLVAEFTDGGDVAEALAAFDVAKQETDFDFYFSEIPEAIDQTLEGAHRVAGIVKSMKEFAHPGSNKKEAVDINHALRTTVQVSRNEWKYVANVDLDLDENLPLVPALSGPLNQAFLNVIMNAAQAIRSSMPPNTDQRGVIKITTRLDDGFAEIRISDTGPGIPDDVVGRIFDPFFTTKDVGKGSGQGLSIARSVLVDKHGGDLTYDGTGPGATFVMRLPMILQEGESRL